MVYRVGIRLTLDPEDVERLQKLPWHKPLVEWKRREAKFLQVKSGISPLHTFSTE